MVTYKTESIWDHYFHSNEANKSFRYFLDLSESIKYWTSTVYIHLATEKYGSEYFAPGYQDPLFSGYSDYKSLHNCFITREIVYKIYNEEFREKQKGTYRAYDFILFNYYNSVKVFEGFLNCLKWVKDKMNNPKICIGENGFPEEDGIDESETKIAYHTIHLNSLSVIAYWKRFGIYAVDFNDESRSCSKKNSSPFFQQLFQTKKLQIKN
ncbi:myrosinase 1-like [Aphis craccivora]|uniref:Myrosinase 1-like n=1 Tax=Aphis craccivora TaxID=307492 RepID=A0A6G0YN49_APHCR|nr:myrosinase 1-like [Aphis craccivora]